MNPTDIAFTGNVVLMDTRHHKTICLPCYCASIEMPVETYDWRIGTVVFKFAGVVAGDPIYLQARGPELPDSWWAPPRWMDRSMKLEGVPIGISS